MTQDLAARLEAMMRQYGIAELDIDEGDQQIRLRRRGPAGVPTGAAGACAATPSMEKTADGSATILVRAGTFGTLHLKHPASATGAPSLPRTARAGEIVAWLAIGPLLRPVVAERNLTLVRLVPVEGAEIGYGDPVFEAVEA